MTSEGSPAEAYVWVWLPRAVEPVVAGRLRARDDIVTFQYGSSYLRLDDAVPLYLPELPKQTGVQRPADGLGIAGCVADAGPDSWGQRIIMERRGGANRLEGRYDAIGPLGFLLESGSDRFGALDFQVSPEHYVARATQQAPLEKLLEAADRLEQGLPLDPVLEQALFHGSSLGGARPKALLQTDDELGRIAKFARRSDPYPVVGAEGAAMWLARQVGINVAAVEVLRCGDSDVLLVERFDRPGAGQRAMTVSALTLQGLDAATGGRYATYTNLAHDIRKRFTEPKATLRELFARIAFNICVGNTDDHARNHAAFWDGRTEMLTLTPAYDICPQSRAGGETQQAMAYDAAGTERRSRLSTLVESSDLYQLTKDEAREVASEIVDTIERRWSEAAEFARLSTADGARLMGTQILNPSIHY